MSEVWSNRLKDKLNTIHSNTYSKALNLIQLTSQKLTLNKENDVWVKYEKVKDEQ